MDFAKKHNSRDARVLKLYELVVRHSLEFRLNPLAVLAIATVFVVRTGAIAQAANPKIKLRRNTSLCRGNCRINTSPTRKRGTLPHHVHPWND